MRPVLLVIFVTLLASCSKDHDKTVYPPAGGTWTINEAQTSASFSEITARKGFLLSFSDQAATTSISFLFRSRPTQEAVFIAAADTSLGSNVAIRLENGGRGFHAVNGINAEVGLKLEEGKLHLTATRVRMVPDSGSSPETAVSFDLKEY